MCIDMQETNRTIKLIKHIILTIDDLIADVNGATVFTKMGI